MANKLGNFVKNWETERNMIHHQRKRYRENLMKIGPNSESGWEWQRETANVLICTKFVTTGKHRENHPISFTKVAQILKLQL